MKAGRAGNRLYRRTLAIRYQGHRALLATFALLIVPVIPSPALGQTNPDMSQEGLPSTQIFTAEDYGAGQQNWALTQDDRGVIYVGNVDGHVLNFDGVRWRSIPVPKAATVRSLATDSSGRVYVGTVGNFGYLGSDEDGREQFVSLLDKVPAQHREFADVWQILPTENGVYFSTFAALFRLRNGEMKVWRPETSFHLSFRIGQRLFVRQVDHGLMELIDGELQMVPGGERFAEERIYAMLALDTGNTEPPGEKILIGTRSSGWFVHDGAKLRPWENGADAFLGEDMLYDAVRLEDGRFAIATLRGGLILLDRNGRLLRRITRREGLPDNGIFDLYEDTQGGLWLATNDGLVRMSLKPSVSRYDQTLGLPGAVLTIARYQGTLFAGTTDGLFRMTPGADGGGSFSEVPEVKGQTWDLLPYKEGLLIANMQGVYDWREDQVELVRPSAQTSFVLLPSASDKQRVFIGMHTGLASIYSNDSSGWVDEGQIAGIEDEIRTLFQTESGDLWLGTWYRGAIRLRPDDQGAGPRSWFEPERFGIVEEPPELSLVYVHPIDGDVRFGSQRGLFRFDADRGGLVRDEQFDGLHDGSSRRIFPFHQDPTDGVWMYTESSDGTIKQSGLARKTAAGGYEWDAVGTAPLAGITVQTIHAESDGVIWFGTNDGLFRHDTGEETIAGHEYQTLIRRVLNRESGREYYSGYGPAPVPEIEYAENSLRFEYAAPSFDLLDETRYRVLLEGLDQNWSAWSMETYRDYTQIREGHYRFRVQARNAYGIHGEESVFEFRIVPPWYRTAWAYAGYALITVMLVLGGFQWRSASLRRHNRLLATQVADRTRELSSVNQELAAANRALAEQILTDPLTGLRNRRYLLEQLPDDVSLVSRHYRDNPAKSNNQLACNIDLLFLMIDIDHFKKINDRFGHSAGDRVLEQFGSILLREIRDSDIAVRWGGEEFLVVARFTSAGYAPVLAERLRYAVAAHSFDLGSGIQVSLTCSIGYAQYPLFPHCPSEIDWEETVNVADNCLYAAKFAWRDAWVGVRGDEIKPPDALTERVAEQLPELVDRGFLKVMASHSNTAGVQWPRRNP